MGTAADRDLGIRLAIEIESGSLAGERRTYSQPGRVLLGKHKDADLMFAEQDSEVSLHHLEFVIRKKDCLLTDLGSASGTILLPSGEQIQSLRMVPSQYPYSLSLGAKGPRCKVQVSNTISFGAYRVIAQLGKGGMATVFVANESSDLNRLVVLKLIHPNLFYTFEKRDAGAMLIEEARIVSQINHPHVVNIHDVGIEGGVHYIAMEYLRGVNLAEVLQSLSSQGLRLPFDLAAALIAQACWGLHSAHEAQDASGRPLSIVHRDFSPSNLVLSPEGDVKLIDFGVARAVGRQHLNQEGQFVGKPAYASPEQIQYPGQVRRTSDLFSAAAVLFELCAMRPLFQRDSDAATMFAVLHEPLPAIKGLPSELENVLARGLAKDPAERIQTAAELAMLLEQFVIRSGGRFLTHRAIAEALLHAGVVLRAAPPQPILGWPEIFPRPDADSAPVKISRSSPPLSNKTALTPQSEICIAGQEYQIESVLSEQPEDKSQQLATRTLLVTTSSQEPSGSTQRWSLRLFGGAGILKPLPSAANKRWEGFVARWHKQSQASAHPLGKLEQFGPAWRDGPSYLLIPYYAQTLASYRSARFLREDERHELGQRLCGALVSANQLWPGFVHGRLSPTRIALPYLAAAVRPAGTDKLSIALLGMDIEWLLSVPPGSSGIPQVSESDRHKHTAPERLAGQPASPAADVYSVAAILYELYGGDLRFAQKSLARGLPIPLSGADGSIPSPIGEALSAALSFDPQQRPTAAELMRRLRRDSSAMVSALPVTVPEAKQSVTVGDKSKITISALELSRRDHRAPQLLPFNAVPGLLPVGLEVSVFDSGLAVELREQCDSMGQRVRLYEDGDPTGRSRLFVSAARGRFELGNRRQSWLQSIDYQRMSGEELLLSDGTAMRLQRVPALKEADHIVLHTRDTRSGVTHLVSISITH